RIPLPSPWPISGIRFAPNTSRATIMIRTIFPAPSSMANSASEERSGGVIGNGYADQAQYGHVQPARADSEGDQRRAGREKLLHQCRQEATDQKAGDEHAKVKARALGPDGHQRRRSSTYANDARSVSRAGVSGNIPKSSSACVASR